MTRTPSNYDESQRSAAGQEEDGSVYGLELKDEEDSELHKVVKVPKSLVDLAGAGYDPKVMATEVELGSPVNSGTAATNKQEHVDDGVSFLSLVDDYGGGDDKDGVVDREKLSRREVVSNVNKIVDVDPLGLLPPTSIKDESLLQNLIKAVLERGEPLQCKLDKEERAAGQEKKLMKDALMYPKTGGLLEERTLSGSKSFASTCLDFMDSVTVKAIGSKRAKKEVYHLLSVLRSES